MIGRCRYIVLFGKILFLPLLICKAIKIDAIQHGYLLKNWSTYNLVHFLTYDTYHNILWRTNVSEGRTHKNTHYLVDNWNIQDFRASYWLLIRNIRI